MNILNKEIEMTEEQKRTAIKEKASNYRES